MIAGIGYVKGFPDETKSPGSVERSFVCGSVIQIGMTVAELAKYAALMGAFQNSVVRRIGYV